MPPAPSDVPAGEGREADGGTDCRAVRESSADNHLDTLWSPTALGTEGSSVAPDQPHTADPANAAPTTASTQQSTTTSSLRPRIGAPQPLSISIPPSIRRQQQPVLDPSAMPASTPRSARSHEASPLTPLEERVFRGHEGGARAYNVFDDDSVLRVCDDEAGHGALGHDPAQAGAAAHGWRIDNVIDKYGNRIASRSRRLARIVAHRKGGSSGNSALGAPVDFARNPGSPTLLPAGRAAHHQYRRRASARGSSSTAGWASSTSTSPMLGRPAAAELGAEGHAAPLARVQDSHMGGLISKARLRMQQASFRNGRARRKHGVSLDSTASNGQDGDVGSFGGPGYSTSASTSTILHCRGRSESTSSAFTAAARQRWWTGLLRQNRRRRPPARRPFNVAPSPQVGNSDGAVLDMRSGHDGYFNGHEAAKDTENDQKVGPIRGAVRKVWTGIVGFVMPGGHNRFGMRDERSYTESIGFLLAFALASVAFIMWGTLVPKALCSTDQTFTLEDIGSRQFVSANGIVSDFTLSHNSFGHAMRGYTGYDISTIFPLLGQLSPGTFEELPKSESSILEKCVSDRTTVENFIESWVANSTLYRGDINYFPQVCPFPQSPQTSGAMCMVPSWPQFPSAKVGMLKLNKTEVSSRHGSPATSWVIIDDVVYDVSQYVQYATDQIIHNGTVDSNRSLREENMFLPRALSQLFISKPGMDITDDFGDLDIDKVLYKQCMKALFLRGTTVATKSPFACANTNVVAWVTFGLYFLVLFSRIATAEIYARVRARKAVLSLAHPMEQLVQTASLPLSGGGEGGAPTDSGRQSADGDEDLGQMKGPGGPPAGANPPPNAFLSGDSAASQRSRSADGRSLEAGGTAGRYGATIAKCLIVVPCFQETLETLTGTLQGIARSAHADSHKVLWIINDGNAEVLASIIRALEHSGYVSDPKFYGAYSVEGNSSSYGSARVYAGYYECGRHRIPYVVTAKETYQGTVDSLMMVLNFFRSLSNSPRQPVSPGGDGATVRSMQPQTIFLEEEVEARMALLGHPPATIDYCLLIGSSVQLDPLAITQFVARMERNASIIALSGTLYPVGRPTSLLQILQFFEFYLRYFVSPICDSLSNVTCPLNQLFTMYRVRLESGDRCLGDEELVTSMDSLMKSSVRYRHRTWPGNDCLLVPRMVRRFPHHCWSFEPNGRAEVELTAHVMEAFDPYERQWFRTRLVTLFDILRGRMLKRTLPIILGHILFPFIVPAAACMLYLEIVISMFGDSPAIVVSELTAAFLAATVVLLLISRKWQLAIFFLVYSAIAVPFYHVWIPVTSFLSMNRIWYSPEQLEAQMATAEAQIQPPENFEEIKNSYLRRFNAGRRQQGTHTRPSLDSQSSSGVRFGPENPDASSDSEPEMIELPATTGRRKYQPNGGHSTGLGLSIPEAGTSASSPLRRQAFNPGQISVGGMLLADARAVLRQLLQDHPQKIEPESIEFYNLCEQALRILIPKHPGSSVAELAMAVNRAIDEALGGGSPAISVPSIASQSLGSPRTESGSVKSKGSSSSSGLGAVEAQKPLGTAFIPQHTAHQYTAGPPPTQKYTRQRSGYVEKRPVSVIMEESDGE